MAPSSSLKSLSRAWVRRVDVGFGLGLDLGLGLSLGLGVGLGLVQNGWCFGLCKMVTAQLLGQPIQSLKHVKCGTKPFPNSPPAASS